MKIIMSVGQCNPDHNALAKFLTTNLNCKILRIDSTEEAIQSLQTEKVDLVLVNRKLDIDYTDGTMLIERMQKNENLKSIPVMLISNYAEYQEEAVKLGAKKGFGKQEYNSIDAIQRLKKVLNLVEEVKQL